MTLFVRSYGSGPDLVLLHGWGFHGGIWDDLINPLVELGYRVHVVDLPGHGQSHVATVSLKLDDWAAAVRKVIPVNSIWVGWSLGGMVALAAATDNVKEIRALVLVGASPCFVRDVDWPALDAELLTAFAHELNKNWRATLSRFWALQTMSSAGQSVVRHARIKILAIPPAPSALNVGLQLLRDTDLRPRLSQISCPTLVLLGERDTIVPIAISDHLARLRPTWKIQHFAGAGHLSFITHQAEFLTALVNFIDGISGRKKCCIPLAMT